MISITLALSNKIAYAVRPCIAWCARLCVSLQGTWLNGDRLYEENQLNKCNKRRDRRPTDQDVKRGEVDVVDVGVHKVVEK